MKYKALHNMVSRAKGPAKLHKCIDCDDEAVDWSTIHGKDGNDPNEYEPRCKRCHILYDKSTLGEMNGNSKVTEDEVLELREMYATGKYTKKELGDLFGLTNDGVKSIVLRRTWKHI
jgi:hypothetical protein